MQSLGIGGILRCVVLVDGLNNIWISGGLRQMLPYALGRRARQDPASLLTCWSTCGCCLALPIKAFRWWRSAGSKEVMVQWLSITVLWRGKSHLMMICCFSSCRIDVAFSCWILLSRFVIGEANASGPAAVLTVCRFSPCRLNSWEPCTLSLN